MTIGERILKIMREKGITQVAFSANTGIPQSTISEWGRRKISPSSDKLSLICRALGISLNELLQEDPSNAEVDYLIVTKGTERAYLLEIYDSISKDSRNRLIGYAEALAQAKE